MAAQLVAARKWQLGLWQIGLWQIGLWQLSLWHFRKWQCRQITSPIQELLEISHLVAKVKISKEEMELSQWDVAKTIRE